MGRGHEGARGTPAGGFSPRGTDWPHKAVGRAPTITSPSGGGRPASARRVRGADEGLEGTLLNLAAETERAGRVADGRKAQARLLGRDENGEAGHVKAALRLGELARFKPYDIGLVAPEHLREARDEPQLVAAADRDPVRDAAGGAGSGVEGIGNGPDLGTLELRELLQVRFDIGGRDTLGKLAQRHEFRAGAERREGRVSQID